MKASTCPISQQDGFGCCQQIAAHIGGMARACVRHRPIHFAFHWSGICRAVRAKLDLLEARKDKSGARLTALYTSRP